MSDRIAELEEALRDVSRRLRSLAKARKCKCQTTAGYTHHCEPCRALAAAERFEQLAVPQRREEQ